MRAAAIRFDLRIPHSQSLKEKRAVVRPLIEGIKRLLSASISEVDHHDAWQRCSLGVAVVAPDGGRLESLVDRVVRYVDASPEVEVLTVAVSYLEEPAPGWMPIRGRD
jgi:uncharacterized protein YlxP (DUF503 family)